MKSNKVWGVCLLLVASLPMTGCKEPWRDAAAASTEEEISPATIEHLEGDEPTRVTLTALAAKRLDIQTAPTEASMQSGAPVVVDYAAILYDTQGDTWTYINPEPLIFVRHHVVIDHIDGDLAYLSDGPAAGMAVVTVGAQELYGAEVEFEEE